MSTMAASRGRIPAFYTNKAVDLYSSKPSTPISLRHLINFGKASRNRSPKQEVQKLLVAANFIKNEMPVRLSHRLRDLQQLPFVVANHPSLQHVYDLYLETFEAFRRYPTLHTEEDNVKFCEFLSRSLNEHVLVVPELAIGVAESPPDVFPAQELDTFMMRMLRSRISRRVVIEQQIALTEQFEARQAHRAVDDHKVGVVDTRLDPNETVRKCTELLSRSEKLGHVPVVVEGGAKPFAYVSEHLEYIILELMKHAAQCTVAAHGREEAQDYPVEVTIVDGKTELQLRITDHGGGLLPYGGIPPTSEEQEAIAIDAIANPSVVGPSTAERRDIFSFSLMRRQHRQDGSGAIRTLMSRREMAGSAKDRHQAARERGSDRQRGLDQTGGMDALSIEAATSSGLGLPLTKIFVDYFSGDLRIFTLQGEGSVAFASIPKFGTSAN